MAKSKSKASKKKRKGKSKKSAPSVPKSLRKGSLPSSLDEVLSAGLGALREAQRSGSDRFDALVERGREIQKAGSDATRDAAREVERAVDRMKDAVVSAPRAVAGSLQDQVDAAVQRTLGTLGVPGRDEIRDLQATIEALEARLLSDGEPAPKAVDRTVYEVRSHDEGWAVQRVGAERATAVRKTKKEALHEARGLARKHAPSRLVTYRLDGTAGDTTDYDDA